MSWVVASGSGGGMTGGAGDGNGGRKRKNKRRIIPLPRPPVTTSSSSIGQPSDDDDADKNEAQSELSNAALNSMASLEDTLPIKKGLSNFYKGKSKSFTNLNGVESKLKMEDLVKPDYQVNKKRRLMVAEALSRKNSRPFSPVMVSKKDGGGSSKNKSNGQDESDDQSID